MKYLDRIADRMLQLRLEAFGAVQIVGPKWCGKTTTAMQQSKRISGDGTHQTILAAQRRNATTDRRVAGSTSFMGCCSEYRR